MDGRLPVGGPRIEDLLEAVPITVAELRGAVGFFEEDTAGMLRASIATAERAFTELNACDSVIDEAGVRGENAAGRLRQLLTQEAREEVAAELTALDVIAGKVRQSAATLRLLNRILDRETSAEDDAPPADVARLRETDLRTVPSTYGDDAEYDDLLAMADRGTQLAPQLEKAHRERLSAVADHLVTVVQQAAKTGFADERFAQASLREARAAHALWLRCLEQRQHDLGK
ncbi:hypothetical protein [Streptomyces sp. NRRL S-37]|uniref:hypothetical protein n=1 Tax=Streptomyces sp. NRRL S-37 TaxID=1463903 RepID=UPI0004CC1FA5|nr:hypothetical protein [Streptomyces sp. NRRL S-37]